ncbi:PAS domain S-box-containing protein/diguanylate cyclase (GGDEF)-like protein [Mobilisporobacter senegalensis]|uniref:PAS domain S-box-containing protein/diguanylate cyclase (GGDEF)-like protein n=1 Tax=Mobilisporobacter senegalensis TaxID=1329262 RepID=A0A3N1XMX9_9FIRM|nr:GGDEF domain-containing protein [Mobilisporobacter senegalensis]ROR26432.1 PAS domain S-box-containing protein/diguanylate cyclase (GGDEF)-like protein [Mobilisporobacter senegalensis]
MKLNWLKRSHNLFHTNDRKSIYTKELQRDALLLDIIMNGSDDTIYFKDKNLKFILNSKAHAIQFGFENPKELVGKSDFDFFPEEFAIESFKDEQRIMKTGKPLIGKLEKWIRKDGEIVWFHASKYPLYDESGEIMGIWGTSRDITSLKFAQDELARLNKELEKANLKLQKKSYVDGLSELFNQRCFYEVLEETINIYSNKHDTDNTFCIMLIDIDYFKLINDSFGHLIGDKAIKFIADIIHENTRSSDSCFRWGGDEFAIILLDTDLEEGKNMADRLCQKIEASNFKVNDVDFKITVSIGVSCHSDEKDLSNLLRKADERLYISKHQGRNQVN